MHRHFLFALVVTAGIAPLPGATLQRLSLNDMIAKSTAIVRGTVTGSKAYASGPIIYTHYAIQVTERYKGGAQDGQDVAVPGGSTNHLRQSFPGAPELTAGQEYVLFLWTGPSGLTQIIGLTQGLFTLSTTASGTTATRPPAAEMMLDSGSGQQVKDQTLSMTLGELRTRVTSALRGGGN
ncbi:MAG TPA: hypothetical protein VG096_16400 [Bryobacteraceae bacterium]|nr:hypothetical protein [Bryobacteraceae bacterium]